MKPSYLTAFADETLPSGKISHVNNVGSGGVFGLNVALAGEDDTETSDFVKSTMTVTCCEPYYNNN